MLKTLAHHFSLQSHTMRYALRLTLALSFVVLIYTTLNLPNGYWAAFSVIACVFPTQGESLHRAKHRIIGTFIGMCLGIVIAHSLTENLILLDSLIALFVFLAFYSKVFSYQLFATFNTVLAVLFIIMIYPGDWQVALIRLEMTVFGAAVAVLATITILPSRTSSLFDKQLSQVRSNLRIFYLSIITTNNTKPLITQMLVIKNLQETHDKLQDAKKEFFKKVNERAYQYLLEMYQTLLLIKVHFPSQNEDEKMTNVVNELPTLLQQIGDLFLPNNNVNVETLNLKLESMLQEVLSLRVKSSFDTHIKTASQYQRMQMTLFLKSLLELITLLTASKNTA